MNKRKYYLVSTSHLSDRIWFRDDEDFRVAMNLVAVVAFVTGVEVLAFVLMSNHVHFVLFADREECSRFISLFKQLYGRYYGRKYPGMNLLRRNDTDIREVEAEGESLERAIAYVQMNPVAANICPHPFQYPWGCGNVFFNPGRPDGVPLSGISLREQFKLIHSRIPLPKNYRVLPEGYIDPSTYVSLETVTAIFGTPKRYNYFLVNSTKAKTRIEERPSPSFRDQVVLGAMQDLCRTVFRKSDVKDLAPGERAELFRQLRWRMNAELAQIARISGCSYREVADMLDSV